MATVAVAIVCKTPIEGEAKTRLAPLLSPRECAALSAAFIRDIAETVDTLAEDGEVTGYAVYTPRGSDGALRPLLPEGFHLLPQIDGDLSARLTQAAAELFAAGHTGAILMNSDSPTLPRAILRAAVDAVGGGDRIVLGPALDGGYTLIGLSQPHPQIFSDLPWSTDAVCRLTRARADDLGLPVVEVPTWYDVDDEASLRMLAAELGGRSPAFPGAEFSGAPAPATRAFLAARKAAPSPSSGTLARLR